MRAEDVLPDEVNQAVLNGVSVRKGSVAAFLANAKVLLDKEKSTEEKHLAEKDLLALIPALNALGLFEILQIKDESLRQFIASTINAENLG